VDKYSILVPIGCRSDEGLSAPVIARLKKQDWCTVYTLDLIPQKYGLSYEKTHCFLKCHNIDLVLCTGDRVEMAAAAQAAFLTNIKIAHLYAGSLSNISTYDDYLRHEITLLSDLQLCESVAAQWVVWDLKKAVGLPVNSFDVGITHLDDLEIDESLVPKEKIEYDNYDGGYWQTKPYDLILYNTPTKTNYSKDIAQIRELIEGSYSVLVSGNPDGDAEMLLLGRERCIDEVHIDLSRAQFLGLLKNCTRFLSNSSVCVYEAPYFLKPEQIIQIGERNKGRGTVVCKPGGSNMVVKCIKEFLCQTVV
jgi:UDP-N-acetylglucosamine 2-epimerase